MRGYTPAPPLRGTAPARPSRCRRCRAPAAVAPPRCRRAPSPHPQQPSGHPPPQAPPRPRRPSLSCRLRPSTPDSQVIQRSAQVDFQEACAHTFMQHSMLTTALSEEHHFRCTSSRNGQRERLKEYIQRYLCSSEGQCSTAHVVPLCVVQVLSPSSAPLSAGCGVPQPSGAPLPPRSPLPPRQLSAGGLPTVDL